MEDKVDIWKTDEEILEIFASRIKARRKKNKLSQAELAQETGISLKTIKNMESAENFNFSNFIKIVRAFSDFEKLDKVLKAEELTPKEKFLAKNN